MDNIFSTVNIRLFSPLSSKDRSANYELLMKIYNLFSDNETRPVIQKEELVFELAAYIRERNFSDLVTDSDELIESQNPREKALMKINQFRKCGWLIEDTTDGFETSVSLDGNVIPILETLKKVSENKSQIEYTGYVYIIYNTLVQFDNSKATALLEQVYKNTRELMGNLQGLSTRIKRFINDLLQDPENTPEKILETLLVKYQNQVLYTVFNNLRTKDNPNRYSTEILKRMYEFLEPERMKLLVSNYIETKSLKDLTEDSRNEIEKDISRMIMYVISQFEYISELINIIDSRNTKYLKSANARLKFLLNNNKDVEGILVGVMKEIKNIAEGNFDWSSVVKTYSVANPDSKSLFERSFDKTEKTFVKLETPKIDDSACSILREKLFAEDLFSKEKVRQFVLSKLGSREKINSFEIDIPDINSLIMMIMVQIFSQDDDMPYTTCLKDEKLTYFEFSMNGFDIIRKGVEII